MIDDYRNTVYCQPYSNIGDKKKKLVEKIRKKHPHAKDMHAIIYSNKDIYKDEFMKIYNHKCAYCGVSSEVITQCHSDKKFCFPSLVPFLINFKIIIYKSFKLCLSYNEQTLWRYIV